MQSAPSWEKKTEKWIKSQKAIDVIIFGSHARGKSAPNDVDLCILIKDSEEKKSIDLVSSLSNAIETKEFKFHMSIMTASEFVKGSTLAKTLLNEGWSIKNRKSLAATLGFENKSLFIYTLRHFSPSKRVQFHYLLKGRYGSKGMLDEAGGNFIGTGSILVPASKEDFMKEILDRWDVKYTLERILVS
jgi:predicted nucleotidyltransferase